ncbi:hypothetical protein [Pseudomonas guariconensis]|uniref:hypothetical protein n=1 Tax=Pseudomonas guariconensis TaxID=1288410 RepID=UPI0011138B57|nr:hypothetical protein [Pseudomonas guariconensis]
MGNKISKTTISGTPPQWSDDQFNHRLRVRLHAYGNTRESTVIVSHPLEHDWLKLVAEKVQEGYTLDRRWPITHAELTHAVPMIKPQSVQDEEKEALKVQVKEDYVAYLQASCNEYKAQLTRQLLEAAEERDRRKAQEAADKRRREAEREAAECFGELVVPDGFPEQKPALLSLSVSAE